MKILVTGANGFMGRGVIEQLVSSGNEIIATDFVDCDYSGVVSKAGDIFNVENPYEYFGEPDVLVHLAWRDGFKHNSENHINDLSKHYNFLNKMVKSGISKIVVLGSMHEVGFHEGSINENTECNPLSLYGIAKNSLRQLCEIMVKGTDTKLQWIRGFYIVDNSSKGCSIFSKLVQASENGQVDFPFTTGINQYDFLNYSEFCEQVAAVVMDNDEFGIINVCSGKPESLASRVERFIKENNLNIKLKYGVYPDRPYDSLAIWGDAKKIKTILNKQKEK